MVNLNLQYYGVPRIFAPKYPPDIFSVKPGPSSPRKGYPGVPGKIRAQFFGPPVPPAIFFLLTRIMPHGKGHRGSLMEQWDIECQNTPYPVNFFRKNAFFENEKLFSVPVNIF
jgi:hypothetical protein